MPEAAVAARVAPKGGRPRLYADQSALEALMGRVATLEVSRPCVTEGGAPGQTLSVVGANDDKRFVEECIVALISAGVFTGGDGDLAAISGVVGAMVLCRDLVLGNLGTQRDQRFAQLREGGYLKCFGILPQ